MALVSMFLCNQSYASHGRDFLLGATILNFNGREAGLDLIIGDLGEMWESVSQGPATENIAVL